MHTPPYDCTCTGDRAPWAFAKRDPKTVTAALELLARSCQNFGRQVHYLSPSIEVCTVHMQQQNELLLWHSLAHTVSGEANQQISSRTTRCRRSTA